MEPASSQQRTTLIPATALVMAALVLCAPAVAFMTLPFLYGPIAFVTFRYDYSARCVLSSSTDLAATQPQMASPVIVAPGVPIPTTPTSATALPRQPAVATGAAATAGSRRLLSYPNVMWWFTSLEAAPPPIPSVELPKKLTPVHVIPLHPAHPVQIPASPGAAGAILNPGGGAAHGMPPRSLPPHAPHGWPFMPPHPPPTLAPPPDGHTLTSSPLVAETAKDKMYTNFPDNYADYLLTFLAVLGVVGTATGIFFLYKLVIRTIIRPDAAAESYKASGACAQELYGTDGLSHMPMGAELDGLDGSDGLPTDEHPSQAYEKYSPIVEHMNKLIALGVLLALLQLYIVVATFWAYSQDGKACAAQGGYATLLIHHSRTYLAALWAGGALIATLMTALMLMHKQWFTPYFLELNMSPRH